MANISRKIKRKPSASNATSVTRSRWSASKAKARPRFLWSKSTNPIRTRQPRGSVNIASNSTLPVSNLPRHAQRGRQRQFVILFQQRLSRQGLEVRGTRCARIGKCRPISYPAAAQLQSQPNALRHRFRIPLAVTRLSNVSRAQEYRCRPMPVDHEGRTNDLCLSCHIPTLSSDAKSAQAGKPPSIPHDLAGRAECLGCHGSGTANVPQIPQSHKDAKFTSGQCTNCHQPSKQGELTPIPTPPSQVTPSPQDNDGDEVTPTP